MQVWFAWIWEINLRGRWGDDSREETQWTFFHEMTSSAFGDSLESGPKVAMITLWNYLYVDMQFDFLIKIWMIMYVNIYDVPLFITDKLM